MAVDDRFPEISGIVRAQIEDRSRLGNIVPERFPSLRITPRRREIQSECSCNGGTLGFPGGWSELSKPACENNGCQWRTDAG